MGTDHDGRVVRRHPVKSAYPGIALALQRGLHEPHVHIVVNDVATGSELEIRHVEERRVVGVGVAHVHGLKPMALEEEPVVLERLREDLEGGLGDLAREKPVPECARLGRYLGDHVVDRFLRRHDPNAGEPLLQIHGVEPVVAVAVGYVDGGKPLFAEGVLEPVPEGNALLYGEERVYEHGF